MLMTLVMGQIEQGFPILSFKKDHQIQAWRGSLLDNAPN